MILNFELVHKKDMLSEQLGIYLSIISPIMPEKNNEMFAETCYTILEMLYSDLEFLLKCYSKNILNVSSFFFLFIKII